MNGMSAIQQLEKEIREACVFLREKNQTVPSETIQFMLDASLEKLRHPDQEVKTYWFDCWNRKGKTFTKKIITLSVEQAKIIFEDKYPDLGYDEPYT